MALYLCQNDFALFFYHVLITSPLELRRIELLLGQSTGRSAYTYRNLRIPIEIISMGLWGETKGLWVDRGMFTSEG